MSDDKFAEKKISVEEAVETLATIADLDTASNREFHAKMDIIGRPLSTRQVEWIFTGSDSFKTVDLIKKCFKTVHGYLKSLYRDQDPYLMSRKTVEGVKGIMVVVGEAAKKLEHFSYLFEAYGGSCLQMMEYKELENFYQKKIDPKVSEETLSKWIFGIGQLPFSKMGEAKSVKKVVQLKSQHLYVDMEAVRNDTDYELFYIRKEDGGRFFNPRLIRNIKLISDFGFHAQTDEASQVLPMIEWKDNAACKTADHMCKRLKPLIDIFIAQRNKYKERDLAGRIFNMILALYMASHKSNLYKLQGAKFCSEYFLDFIGFLSQVINHYDYQHLLSYPPRPSNRLGQLVLSLVNQTARVFMTEAYGTELAQPLVSWLINQGSDEKGVEIDLNNVGKTLTHDSQALSKTLKKYNNSPLSRLLDDLEVFRFSGFCPIIEENYPNLIGDLVVGTKPIAVVRMPTPTHQENLNNPQVLQMFQSGLRGYFQSHNEAKLLLLNFQNRTSWKEYKRCNALENLNDQEEWNFFLSTMEVDTDFYDQNSPFKDDHDAALFKEILNDHLQKDGAFFPEALEDTLFPFFIDELINEVHAFFFLEKVKLTPKERCLFIDIVHVFMQLKMIDTLNPQIVFYTCKDGVDVSPLQFAAVFYMLYAMNCRNWGEKERDFFNTQIFSSALIQRERSVLPARVERLIELINWVELIRSDCGEHLFEDNIKVRFGRLYHFPVLDAQFMSR